MVRLKVFTEYFRLKDYHLTENEKKANYQLFPRSKICEKLRSKITWLWLCKFEWRHIKIYNLSLIHISEPTRRSWISYAVFCLKKKPRTSQDSNLRPSPLKAFSLTVDPRQQLKIGGVKLSSWQLDSEILKEWHSRHQTPHSAIVIRWMSAQCTRIAQSF